MAETINMPKLGFDMAEGLLVRWVKQVGENINKGDVLAEIVDEVRRMRAVADVVLVTGGIGPTHDDVTRPAIAAAIGYTSKVPTRVRNSPTKPDRPGRPADANTKKPNRAA